MPDRIGNLVFRDAVVPENGKSMSDYIIPGWRIGLAVWSRLQTDAPTAGPVFQGQQGGPGQVNRRLTGHPYETLTEQI